MPKAKAKNTGIAARLSRAKGFVLDLDGTLALGDSKNKGLRPLPGAVDFIQHLQAQKIPFVLFTNGTVRPPAAYVPELAETGFHLHANNIMTPASVAAEYFAARKIRRVLVLGGEGVSSPLSDVDIEILRPPQREKVDAIFVGWYPDFGMKDIDVACDAVWSGAKLYCGSLAPYFATANGRTLGASCAIAGAIEKITGTRARLLGKPSTEAMRVAGHRLGAKLTEIAVIGDDPRLEIPMARRAGALAIGVTTGIAKEDAFAALPSGAKAHFVGENIGAVLKAWRA